MARRHTSWIARGTLALAVLAALGAGGCDTSTRSGLPPHIRTVEVRVFNNRTMEHNLEARLTHAIKNRVADDPNLRIVSRDGDAVLSGVIIEVERTPIRETLSDRPATVQITVKAQYSLYDEVERRYLVRDGVTTSSQSSSARGLYEASRGEVETNAIDAAVDEVAREIVRRTIAAW